MRLALVVLLFSLVVARAGDFPTATRVEDGLVLEPIYRLKPMDGKQRFITRNDWDFSRLKTNIEAIAFFAVCTNDWLPGLAPIFGVEKTNRFELRRRPPRGQESGADPLFFGVPLEDDSATVMLSGRWRCDAERGSGSRADLAWELAVETNAVAGRFDQASEYRYGHIAGGTFVSNQFQLRIEYIQDAYWLSGTWRDGKLEGRWRHDDSSEGGAWTATRPQPLRPASTNLVKLYEWRRGTERRYLLDGEAAEPGWERFERPVCRVWRAR